MRLREEFIFTVYTYIYIYIYILGCLKDANNGRIVIESFVVTKRIL